jgi:succinate dehydrogenase / fumarate reductase cytochrome b subunit
MVFLDLFRIRQPLHAILSITHRITGVLIFLLLPVWTYGLYVLRYQSDGMWQRLTENTLIKVIFWGSGVLFLVHLLLGLRHILADLGVIATSHRNLTAYITIALGLVLGLVWLRGAL